MNETQVANYPSAQADGTGTAMSLVMDSNAMDKMIVAAKLMASAKVTIPAHLRNSEGDCMAVIMQAAQWKMNPFAVAQKTHLSQGGQLGYEAQLINAVIASCGAIIGQPEFAFIGDWKKILGKVEERKSDKGGKYYVAGWKTNDEEGLGVVCSATLRGESSPREITIMLSQCYPRFSTQWATDPQQQITYVAVRKFARRYTPGAILGVYEVEELDTPQIEREINPMPKRESAPAASKTPPVYSDEDFKKNLPAWKAAIAKGARPDAIISKVSTRGTLTDAQKAEIRASISPEPPPATAHDPAAPDLCAKIKEQLEKAQSLDELDLACDLIKEVSDEQQRAELSALYQQRLEDLT